MDKKKYHHLIGKSKKLITEELGQEFNYYPSNVWSYLLKKSWWGNKTYLIVYFKNDEVDRVRIGKKI